MKKFISMAMSAAMVGTLLAGCGSSAASSAPASTAASTAASSAATAAPADAVTFVFAEVNPLDTIVGQTDSAFKEKVEEVSGGQIQIDIQPSGVLGDEAAVLDSMLGGSGTIDMSRISAFALTSYGASKSTLLSVPYTFVSREHYWKFVNSDLADAFLSEPSEIGLGVRGLFYGEEGFRHFFTKKEVNGLDDLKGMKLRVSNDPVMVGMVNGLGASPTSIAFNELYSNLQSGTVDGAEQPIANYKSNAFQEVAPNLILDGHTLGAIEIIITDEAWNSLNEEQQGWMMEAAQYACDVNAEISQSAEDKVLDELKAEGVNVVEVADKTAWKDACTDIIAQTIVGQEDLYQQILDMQ